MATYNFEKKSAEEMNRVPHNDGAIKVDGWMNVLSGLGTRGRDKNINVHFRMERIFEQTELDQLYRSDGVTRRIIDLVLSEMVRQGWEIEGDSNQDVNCKMEEIKTNHNLTTLHRWARLYGGALCVMGIANGLSLDESVDEKKFEMSNGSTFSTDINLLTAMEPLKRISIIQIMGFQTFTRSMIHAQEPFSTCTIRASCEPTGLCSLQDSKTSIMDGVIRFFNLSMTNFATTLLPLPMPVSSCKAYPFHA